MNQIINLHFQLRLVLQGPWVASFKGNFTGWSRPSIVNSGVSDVNLACQLGAVMGMEYCLLCITIYGTKKLVW